MVAHPTPAEYAMGYAEGFNDACKPKQGEPVAWGVFEGNLHDMFFSQEEAQEMADLKGTHAEVRPLYTTPPQRQWVGLTDEEIDKAWRSVDYTVPWEQHRIDIARAIENELRAKNNG
jgi:hypothetical protein